MALFQTVDFCVDCRFLVAVLFLVEDGRLVVEERLWEKKVWSVLFVLEVGKVGISQIS